MRFDMFQTNREWVLDTLEPDGDAAEAASSAPAAQVRARIAACPMGHRCRDQREGVPPAEVLEQLILNPAAPTTTPAQCQSDIEPERASASKIWCQRERI